MITLPVVEFVATSILVFCTGVVAGVLIDRWALGTARYARHLFDRRAE